MQDWVTSAIILIALFAGFIALVVWSWSKARQSEFNAASQLPLQDDVAETQTVNKNDD